jgi:hypothetical protein
MQELPVQAEGWSRAPPSVELVTKDGSTTVQHVDADLVGASGLQA